MAVRTRIGVKNRLKDKTKNFENFDLLDLDLTNLIFENRGKKPIITYTDGMLLSAAYAIGAAADAVYISGDTTVVGSIGVVAAHEDISKMEEKLGMKTTEIYAGKFKRIASQYAPLSAEGFTSIKERVDYLYSVFINEVAKFRGIAAEDVFRKMSTDVKPLFMGRQAVDAGLVDGVSTLEQLTSGTVPILRQQMRAVNLGQSPNQSAGSAVSSAGKIQAKEDEIMTKEELKEKNADIYQAVFDEGKASAVADSAKNSQTLQDEARKHGADAERQRIQAVRAQSIPGHEAVIETLMYDGATTGEQAAVKILAAEKTLRASKHAAFIAEGSAIRVPVTEGPDKPTAGAVEPELPVEEKARQEWDNDVKLRAEFGDFKTYLAYARAHSAGQVKILKGKE